jgi:hypothetical protein
MTHQGNPDQPVVLQVQDVEKILEDLDAAAESDPGESTS